LESRVTSPHEEAAVTTAQLTGHRRRELALANRYVNALAARDSESLGSLFAPAVDFRGLTPGMVWEAGAAETVVRDILLVWFGPADDIERIEEVQTALIGTRVRVGYRFAGTCESGAFIVEQQAYFEESDGHITWMRVLCSGFQVTAG
jgi:hypothetical protein